MYYYLAESLLKTDKKPEAVPYYDRLVKEFDHSEYLVDATRDSKRRLLSSLDGGGPEGSLYHPGEICARTGSRVRREGEI